MGQSDALPRTPHGRGSVSRQRFGVDPPGLGKGGDECSFLAWGLRHQTTACRPIGPWLQGPGANLQWGHGVEAVKDVRRDEWISQCLPFFSPSQKSLTRPHPQKPRMLVIATFPLPSHECHTARFFDASIQAHLAKWHDVTKRLLKTNESGHRFCGPSVSVRLFLGKDELTPIQS